MFQVVSVFNIQPYSPYKVEKNICNIYKYSINNKIKKEKNAEENS